VREQAVSNHGPNASATVNTLPLPPLNSSNLNFSQGLTGWAVTSGVSLVAPTGDDAATGVGTAAELYAAPLAEKPLAGAATRQLNANFLGGPPVIAPDRPPADPGAANLWAYTYGIPGPQFARSRIVTTPGSARLVLRYRFYTQEIPAGYYGTPYDDSYGVLAISSSGAVTQDINSMNSLGLGAFDASGLTGWRELAVPVNPSGDTVEVMLFVSNAIDGYFDAGLEVSTVQLRPVAITAISLTDIDGAPLSRLSASPHTYNSGRTVVAGTLQIAGPSHLSIASVTLEIFEGSRRVAVGTLDPVVSGQILGPLSGGSRGGGTPTTPLFQIPSEQFSAVDQQRGTTLTYKVVVVASDNTRVESPTRSVIKLVKINGGRYGLRDPGICVGTNHVCYGDDWGTVVTWIRNVQLGPNYRFNDVSNMNGGPFPIHNTHTDGADVDQRFETDEAYLVRDAAVAERLMQLVNTFDTAIRLIYVTMTPQFRAAIQGRRLGASNRLATQVFVNVGGHEEHFHIAWTQ